MWPTKTGFFSRFTYQWTFGLFLSLLAVKNNTAVDIHAQVFVLDFRFSGACSRERNCWLMCPAFVGTASLFQSDRSGFHPSVWEFQCLHIPASTCYCLPFLLQWVSCDISLWFWLSLSCWRIMLNISFAYWIFICCLGKCSDPLPLLNWVSCLFTVEL